MASQITVQASWHGHQWGILSDAIRGLSALSRLRQLKAVQQQDIAGKGSLNLRGMEPFSCSLSWRSVSAVTSSPESGVRDEIESWERDIGSQDYLEIGGDRWYDKPLRLISVQASEVQLDVHGRILSATITASWQEYVQEAAKARRTAVRKAPSEATYKALGITSGARVGPTKSEKAAQMAKDNDRR